MAHASATGKDRHYLIIGPWDHPGTRTPQAEVAGLKFGEASLLDMNALHKAWYDWTMKGGAEAGVPQGQGRVLRRRRGSVALRADARCGHRARRAVVSRFGRRPRERRVRIGRSRQRKSRPAASPTATSTIRSTRRRPQWETIDVPNGLTDQRGMLNSSGKMLVYHTPPFASGYRHRRLFQAFGVALARSAGYRFRRCRSSRSSPTASASR